MSADLNSDVAEIPLFLALSLHLYIVLILIPVSITKSDALVS